MTNFYLPYKHTHFAPPLATLVLSLLFLNGCESSTESPDAASVESAAALTAAELLARGKQLLYNADTRFEYPEAATTLAQAVTQEPTNSDARLALIYAYTKTGEYDEALPHVVHLRTKKDLLDEKATLWFAAIAARVEDRGDIECGLWRALVTAYPQDRWAWYELATAYMSVEQFTDAAQAAQEALAIEPDAGKWEASWIYYTHAKALFRDGQYSAAIAAAEAGRTNKTTWRSTFYRMGLAQIAIGQPGVADSFVDNYIEISENEGRNNLSYTQANLALFYYELGDFETATQHAKISYELEPKAYQSWALAYSLTENGQAEEGLRILEAAAETFTDDAYVMAATGWTLYRLGRLAEARDAVLAAQAASSRSNFYFGRVLEIIEQAIDEPENTRPQSTLWLG